MTTSEEKCNESVLSDKPYHNPNRFKVRKLLQALEDVTKGSPRQNNSVQLMPSRLEYYSPEKMKFLQKDEDPWRCIAEITQTTRTIDNQRSCSTPFRSTQRKDLCWSAKR